MPYLGLCTALRSRYHIRSNRESSLGCFDIMLLPKTKSLSGFIYEFKFTKDESVDLDQLAETALKQIEEKKYDTERLSAGIATIRKIGLAFRGNQAVVKCA